MSGADQGVGEPETRPAVVESLSTGRWFVYLFGSVFWVWLVVRWLIDWGRFPFGTPGRPLVDPTTLPVDRGWQIAIGALPEMATGAWFTVLLTVVSILLGLVLAVPLSVARVYGDRTSDLSLAFTELVRGTPLIAQLFVLYYGLNLSQYFRGIVDAFGLLPGPAIFVALIGFTINSAAYQSEYIRSAIESVDPDQLTAARSVGLSRGEGIRHVVLPQGLRYAIPGWTNELVYLIKYSSLATFITVSELFTEAQAVATDTFRFTPIFTMVALMCLALVLTATQLMAWVEQRVAVPGLGGAGSR